jgi:hypothetical protein
VAQVLRTYHGPDADPFSALVLANRQRMWFEALRTDVQVRRARGASIQEVLRVKKDYLASSMKNLESMIECQVRPFFFPAGIGSLADRPCYARCSGARP